MSFSDWNDKRLKRWFEKYGDKSDPVPEPKPEPDTEPDPAPEPKSPRLDVPKSETGRWECGEYSGEALTNLKVCKIPNVTPNEPVEAVIPPGMKVEGDLIVTVDGYRWLRLTQPHEYFGKYLVIEDWDKFHTYCQIEHSLSIPQALYRIRIDDPPRMLKPSWRFKSMHWAAPAVHPMYLSKNPVHSTNRTRLSRWETFLRTLNNTKNKWNYYTNDHAGLFNGTGWDKQETLVMGNNLVVVDKIIKGRRGRMAKLRTLFINDPQPDADLLNYQTCPWFIHKFTVITRKGFVVDPNPGAVYYPVITKQGGEGWIQLDKLEKFPSLPMTVTVEEEAGLNVREKPTVKSGKVTALGKGTLLEITEYRPAGSEVWGRCEQGWVALYHPQTTPKYLTSWEMETKPPPP